MKFSIAVLLLIIFLSGLCGCALISTGLYQEVKIVSSEPSSEVYINDEFKDTAPCLVKVRRTINKPPQVEVRKKGYFSENVPLVKKTNKHIWLNLFNIPGWVIDIASGASVRYQQPDTVILQSRKKGTNKSR